jgi:hypothetical protein
MGLRAFHGDIGSLIGRVWASWRGMGKLMEGLHASHGGMRRLVVGLWVGLVWAQSGGWGSSLLEADTVWLDLATTARGWIGRPAV